MKSKVILTDGYNSLIARYNPSFKNYDHFIRTFVIYQGSLKVIEFELTINQTARLQNGESFISMIDEYKMTHDFSYETLLAKIVCSYLVAVYGNQASGVKRIAETILRYQSIAEEFYLNVIIHDKLPEEGICIKGYSALKVKEEFDLSDIQAYFVFIDMIGNINFDTMTERRKHEPPERKLISEETMVLPKLS